MALKNPFSLSPDPAYLYLTDALHASCDKIRFTLDERQGLSVVYGDAGTGKSSLLRYVLGEYSAREDCRVAHMVSPSATTALGLLKDIAGEFGVGVKRSRIAQEQAFRAFLADEYAAGRNVVLLIDEAQQLKGEVLELVRTLLNFETDSAKLISIVLFGQLELRDRLRDPSKKALRSRIFLYSVLEPLTIEDTERMIAFRLERARSALSFDADALQFLFRLGRGIPRNTMRLCKSACILALANGVTTIDAELCQLGAASVELPDDE